MQDMINTWEDHFWFDTNFLDVKYSTYMQSVIGYQASRRNCEFETKVKLVTFPEQVDSRVEVMWLINKLG